MQFYVINFRFVECNRSNFMDELLDHEDGLMNQTLTMNRSSSVAPTANGGNNIPMSDYLVSVHTKLDGPGLSSSSTLPRGGGSIAGISRPPPFNTRRLLNWSRQLARGLRFVHSSGVAHGDLALRNILLSGADVVKISDFGLASRIGAEENYAKTEQQPTGGRCFNKYHNHDNEDDEDSGNAGSCHQDEGRTSFRSSEDEEDGCDSTCRRLHRPLPVAWLSPERFVDPDLVTTDTDAWSLGVTLWELFTLGGHPYADEADLTSDPSALSRFLRSGGRLRDPALAPSHVRVLLRRCFAHDPSDRPSAADIFDDLDPAKPARALPPSSSCTPGYLPMDNRNVGKLHASDGGGVGAGGGSIGTCSTLLLDRTADCGTVHSQDTAVSYWNGYKIINSGAHC